MRLLVVFITLTAALPAQSLGDLATTYFKLIFYS